jgi:Beta-propeller repeat
VIDPELVYSTYLGGSGGGEVGLSVAVDGQGQAYVTGFTSSPNFPLVTPLACCGSLQGGQDAFVSKLSATGNTLLYSTYLGGSGGDAGRGIAVDRQGQAYATGLTVSPNFPLVTPLACCGSLQGGQDAFVSKLSATGNTLLDSTYLGGSGSDNGPGLPAGGIAVDGQGQAYVTGSTRACLQWVSLIGDNCVDSSCAPGGGVCDADTS